MKVCIHCIFFNEWGLFIAYRNLSLQNMHQIRDVFVARLFFILAGSYINNFRITW